ncbi:MAG TPA: maleylpyruvate isomerase N-terminal domain-containing protein [Thermoanaerobaculia bacterium]|nr:maleylpyruvate isomerase N-terminal domain-containing protein [Thermoanaerobaculia bacterium]
MEPLAPLATAELFLPLHDELIALLRGLSPADWERRTAADAWRVRDVAAHLLDVQLRRLSAQRDGHLPAPDEPIRGYAGLVRFLDRLNADWVRAARRLSPRLLVDLLEPAGPAVAALVGALPPHAPALFAVSWAGESGSESWFDVGREYTELWHHQMQIRDAVGAPLLLERRWLHPLLELSVRALPRAYAGLDAAAGSAVVLEVEGEAGGAWSVVREADGWRVFGGAAPAPAAGVRLDADAAWRLFFNAPAAARERAVIAGDPALAAPLFAARAVMV